MSELAELLESMLEAAACNPDEYAFTNAQIAAVVTAPSALRPPEGGMVEAIHAVCLIIENHGALPVDDHTGIVLGDEVEKLAGDILATLNLPARLQAAREEGAAGQREKDARIADKWATNEQREFGNGGPAQAIRSAP